MLNDARLAIRSLRHSPGFTLTAILTVALAVGANTAIFSIADGVLFRPLPFREPDRLFVIESMNPATGRLGSLVSEAYLRAIRDNSSGLSEVARFESGPRVVMSTRDGLEELRTAAVSAGYFEILGARPERGRLLAPTDAGNPRVAVLSYEAWRSRFGGDERLVGQSVAFGPARYDIVGVLPPGFVFLAPLAQRPELVVLYEAPRDSGPNTGAIYPIVRLEPGTTREQANAELATLAQAVMAADSSLRSVPVLQDLRTTLFPAGRPIMQFLLASALLVLLLGCANLANLFLVRARRRDLEIGIRTALGASSARLVRPVVLEAAFIGLAGAALAVVVTRLSFDALVQQVPPIAYRGVRVGLDLRVAFFALLLGLSSGILFSAAAAWRTSRQDAIAVMQGGARRGRSFSRRFGWPLVVAQAALALALVFGASVAAQALVSIVRTPLAFDAENVAAVRVLPAADGVEREAVYQALADRLAAHPDVIAVGAAASLPLDGATVFDSIRGADGSPVLGIDHVLPGYFESIGAQLRAGRLFTVDDLRGDRAVAVISEAFARARFPGRDPIGATFQGADTSTQYRVIGVIADLRTAPDPSEMPVAYVFPGADTRGMVLAVRLARRSDAVLGDLRRLAGTLVPEAPVTARWWSDSLRQLTAYRNPRFQTLVLGGFALLGLILTATGVASVVGALLAGRAREMGVRLAVGATPASLMILLLRYALTPVVAGTLAGIVITRALTQLAEAQLYRVNTDDPRTLVVASVVVIATALAAAFVPARRARRIDPVTMLRSE